MKDGLTVKEFRQSKKFGIILRSIIYPIILCMTEDIPALAVNNVPARSAQERTNGTAAGGTQVKPNADCISPAPSH